MFKGLTFSNKEFYLMLHLKKFGDCPVYSDFSRDAGLNEIPAQLYALLTKYSKEYFFS
jgi:hypothetical protein